MKKVIIIGSGFSSLAASCYLAQSGYEVLVLEKNANLGGRARVMEVPINGNFDTVDNALVSKNEHSQDNSQPVFRFDMGPSWYWMPDVFEKFFADFGKKMSDVYDLRKVSPYFRMFLDDKDFVDLPSEFKDILDLFDNLEKDGGKKLLELLKEGEYTYNKAINDYMNRPSYTITEFMSPEFIFGVLRGGLLDSYQDKIRARFTSSVIHKILEFPVLFLGATPQKTPYLYNLMAYTMLAQGTWYPMGGMHKIVEAMVDIGKSLGVKYITQCQVKKIEVESGVAHSVFIQDLSGGKNLHLFNDNQTGSKGIFGKMNITDFYDINCDFVVSGADYHFTEQILLDSKYHKYDEKYWEKRVMAPSALIYYLGVNKNLPNLTHHNLFFDAPFEEHAEQIYTSPEYPDNPLFYLCVPSKTDNTVAPSGCENLFVLIPIAPGLKDSDAERKRYFDQVMRRISTRVGFDFRENIIYQKNYSVKNFVEDYNAYKGNAYGLANTLDQTAYFKPSLINPKVANLVYCGQLTVPGPGVPPAIISGRLAAQEVIKKDKVHSTNPNDTLGQ